MFYLNEVRIIGRATADAVVKQIGENSTLATFRIASNRKIKKRNGEPEERTTFVDVEVWGQRAEYAGNYVKKGIPVFVQGQLETDEWEQKGPDGNVVVGNNGKPLRRSKLKIYANSIQAERPRSEDSESEEGRQPVSAGAKSSQSDDVPF